MKNNQSRIAGIRVLLEGRANNAVACNKVRSGKQRTENTKKKKAQASLGYVTRFATEQRRGLAFQRSRSPEDFDSDDSSCRTIPFNA